MQRKIVRSYAFNDREVHEALVAFLKSKDRPAPSYTDDTPCTKWTKESHGISVEWTEEGESEI